MAIYHLNHRSVGKKSAAPGTAAAKVRYMVRAKACEKIVIPHPCSTDGFSDRLVELKLGIREDCMGRWGDAQTFNMRLPVSVKTRFEEFLQLVMERHLKAEKAIYVASKDKH